MANKELKHFCVICKNKINKPKERYVRLTDFAGKMKTGECFYHLDCWKNKNQIMRENVLNTVQPMLKKLFSNIKIPKEALKC